MNTASPLLAATVALCLAACAAPAEPVGVRQDTPVARATTAAHVNPPETSSGY